MKEYVQVKINIPASNKRLLAYCKRLSEQRKLSDTVIRLILQNLPENFRPNKDGK